MGGVYYILQDSVGFDNLMHGKSPKGSQKQRSLEDFGKWLSAGLSPVMSGSGRRASMLTGSFYSRLAAACVDTTREVAVGLEALRGSTATKCVVGLAGAEG